MPLFTVFLLVILLVACALGLGACAYIMLTMIIAALSRLGAGASNHPKEKKPDS